MVELADRAVEAAWKIQNLEDYDRLLEDAAGRVDEMNREHDTAALVIYEAALRKSGRSQEEIREMVRTFRETFEDEEELFTIPRVSGIMNVEGDEWFFGDEELRVTTGRLLGQFQHRVAQYNYVDEREVLRRWANSYDTRLFIRRRVYDTEPVVGVVAGFDLPHVQYLRVLAGGDTVVPTGDVARALEVLGFGEAADDYEVMARAENLALQMDLPAPIVGEILEEIAREGRTDFPEPPRDLVEEEPEEASVKEESAGPSAADREARRAADEDPGKGEKPSRVQDPQSSNAPGVEEEAGQERPAAPETGKEDAPGTPAEPEDDS